MKIEHANITVSNIDESFEFYHALMGFEKRWEGEANGESGPVRACHVGTPDFYLSFFEAETQGVAAPNYSRNGINHIGFEVEGLSQYKAKLGAMGVNIHFEQDYDPGTRLYFYDPNGIEIELVEY